MSLSTPPFTDNETYRYLTELKLQVENLSSTTEVTDEQVSEFMDGGAKGDTGLPGQNGSNGDHGQGLRQTSVLPDALTGLVAIPSRTFTILTWDEIPVSNDAETTIIFRSEIDNPLNSNEVGESKTRIYQDYTEEDKIYYYWIASKSFGSVLFPEGRIGAKSVTSVSSDINSLINSSNISEYMNTEVIEAEYVAVDNLAALSANLGDVTAGTLKNSTGTFDIDLTNGYINIAGPNGKNADDYINITDGNIQQYAWNGSSHDIIRQLSVIESGNGKHSDIIYLNKYYDEEPNITIILEDVELSSFHYTGNSNVKLISEVDNIIEYDTGKYKFEVNCSLVNQTGSINKKTYNYTYGPSSGNLSARPYNLDPLNPYTYGFPAPRIGDMGVVSNFAVNLDITSVLGTGTINVFQNRKVSIAIYLESVFGYQRTYWETVEFSLNRITARTIFIMTDSTGTMKGDRYNFAFEISFVSESGTYYESTGNALNTTPINTFKVNYFDIGFDNVNLGDGTLAWRSLGY